MTARRAESHRSERRRSAQRHALVTGASSGLGLEAAAQLAEAGAERVVLAGRSADKVAAAHRALAARVGLDAFEELLIDTAEVDSAERAAAELTSRGTALDLLLLNATTMTPTFTPSSAGIDLVHASAIVGHHVLTVRLLERGLLAPEARIVVAGSESARADLPGIGGRVRDVRADARGHGGDVAAAVVAAATGRAPDRPGVNQRYADAKTLVAWWAAALARRLPDRMAVLAVSPGSAPRTSAGRNMPFVMRRVALPILATVGPALGMAHSVAEGAARYLEAAASADRATSGAFLASPSRRMIGPLTRQHTPHLVDPELQEAGWEAIVRLTGVDLTVSRPPRPPVEPHAPPDHREH